MAYVDGFLLPVPRTNLDAYRRISRKAGKVWREHGALDYKECVGDAKVVKDPRINMNPESMPFDVEADALRRVHSFRRRGVTRLS